MKARWISWAFLLLVGTASAEVKLQVGSWASPSVNSTTGTYATFFLVQRAAYYFQHSDELPPPGKSRVIPPTFANELFAFQKTIAMNREGRAVGRKTRKYWTEMEGVEDAGYLSEYIVECRKLKPGAEQTAPLKTQQFLKWAGENDIDLKKCEVEKYGDIVNEP